MQFIRKRKITQLATVTSGLLSNKNIVYSVVGLHTGIVTKTANISFDGKRLLGLLRIMEIAKYDGVPNELRVLYMVGLEFFYNFHDF